MTAWMTTWMDWLMATMALPQFGLSTVFVVAFVSATLLPLGSEPAVFGLVKLNPDMFWPAVLVATAGNTLGGALTWWMGYGAEQAYERVSHRQPPPHAKPPAVNVPPLTPPLPPTLLPLPPPPPPPDAPPSVPLVLDPPAQLRG